MKTSQSLKYQGDLVRQFDRDRFLTSLFAAPEQRSRLHTLYAFNVELSRIRETVSEPIIGQMRIQWWRDVIDALKRDDSPPKGHPVAEPLANLIREANLPFLLFYRLLEARSHDVSGKPMGSLGELRSYSQGTSGTISELALYCLGVTDTVAKSAARNVGEAWALTGIVRSVRHHALAGRCLLPELIMADVGISLQDLQTPDRSRKAVPLLKKICDQAQELLKEARSTKRQVDVRAMPVLLHATLANQYLIDLERYGYDLFHPRLITQGPSITRLFWNAWRKTF